jgi:hypothetical protein
MRKHDAKQRNHVVRKRKHDVAQGNHFVTEKISYLKILNIKNRETML